MVVHSIRRIHYFRRHSKRLSLYQISTTRFSHSGLPVSDVVAVETVVGKTGTVPP